MDLQKNRSFVIYLAEIAKQSNLETAKVDKIVQNYIDEIEHFNYSDNAESVKITRTKEGEIIVATSLKIPNLHFRVGELIYSLVDKGIKIVSANGEPFRISFFVIGFLRDVFELSNHPLTTQDAKVLVGIYILVKTYSKKIITVDQVVEFFQQELTDSQISKSLAELERIACVALSTNGIQIIETIVIQSS